MFSLRSCGPLVEIDGVFVSSVGKKSDDTPGPSSKPRAWENCGPCAGVRRDAAGAATPRQHAVTAVSGSWPRVLVDWLEVVGDDLSRIVRVVHDHTAVDASVGVLCPMSRGAERFG